MNIPDAKKTFTAFAFASCAVLPAFAQEKQIPVAPPPPDEVTYWKTEFFDAVLALHKCKEQGVCAEVHWLNPKDEKIFEYWADPKLKRSLSTPSGNKSPSEDDIKSICGFRPKSQFKQVAPDRWQGTMDMRGIGMSVKSDVTMVNDKEIRVDTSKLFFSQKETWQRVEQNDPRYPKCFAPKK